jgi:hypothetical protein
MGEFRLDFADCQQRNLHPQRNAQHADLRYIMLDLLLMHDYFYSSSLFSQLSRIEIFSLHISVIRTKIKMPFYYIFLKLVS